MAPGSGVVALAVALAKREKATVVSRRDVIGARSLATIGSDWSVEAVKAAALWMAALLSPRLPRETGRDARIH